MGKAHVFGYATAQKVFDLPFNVFFHTLADVSDEVATRAAASFGFVNRHAKLTHLGGL